MTVTNYTQPFQVCDKHKAEIQANPFHGCWFYVAQNTPILGHYTQCSVGGCRSASTHQADLSRSNCGTWGVYKPTN